MATTSRTLAALLLALTAILSLWCEQLAWKLHCKLNTPAALHCYAQLIIDSAQGCLHIMLTAG